MASQRQSALWDGSHISLPEDFRPFQIAPSWFNFRFFALQNQCVEAITSGGTFFQEVTEIYFLEVMNDIVKGLQQNFLDKENAKECLTQALQAIQFCHKKSLRVKPLYVYELLKLRAQLNFDLNDIKTAVQDITMAKKINVDPELLLLSCRVFRALSQWENCFHETLCLLQWSHDQSKMGSAVILLALSFSKLTDVTKAMKNASFKRMNWSDEPAIWKGIVDLLCEKQEYDALGVLTIGMCDNLMKIPTPDFMILEAAAIPGLKFKDINVGKILLHLNDKGIKRWHVKMGEFLIQRDADIHSIAKEFKRPLLIAMTMLSFHSDTPSFLELVWSKLSVADFDQCDENKETAFHFLARQMAKQENKKYINTAKILCRSLLSKGCLPFLEDCNGNMPFQLVPDNIIIHKMMKEPALYLSDDLKKRLKQLTQLADEKRKEKDEQNLKNAALLYEKIISVQSQYPALRSEMAKLFLKLCIVTYKLEDFQKSHRAAQECFLIESEFSEVSGLTYFWLACTAEKMENLNEAILYCIQGHNLMESEKDVNMILHRGLNLVPKLAEQSLDLGCGILDLFYNTMQDLSTRNKIIEVINQNKLWTVLKIFFLGPPYMSDGGHRGVLWKIPADRVDLHSIWDYLDDSSMEVPRLVLALIQRGADFRKLSSDPKEGLHAVVRFCALTNDTAVLRHVLEKSESARSVNDLDGSGRTPLHTLCQIMNKKVQDDTVITLANLLYGAGCDADLTDCEMKVAADYATGKLKNWMESLQATEKRETMPPSRASAMQSTNKPPSQSGPTKPPSQSGPTKPPSQSGPTKPPSQSGPTKPPTQSGPTKPPTQSGPTKPPTQSGPTKSPMIWQGLKDQGNKLYTSKKYSEALQIYQLADEEMSNEDETNVTNHDRAVVLGNIVECFCKMALWQEAFSVARECVHLDPTWFKVHMRLSHVVQEVNRNNSNAFDGFLQSLICVEKDADEEKNKLGVLSKLLNFPLEDSQSSHMVLLIKDPDLWASLVYQCISTENNWDKAVRAYHFIRGALTRKHSVDLSTFCQKDKLCMPQYHRMVFVMLSWYVKKEDLSSLKFHSGDTCLHAVITILMYGNHFNEEIFRTIVQKAREVYGDNIYDDKGNTPLHHIALTKGNDEMRRVVTCKLLENKADIMKQNKNGQCPVDLCSASDVVRSILEIEMEVLGIAKTQKKKKELTKPTHSPSPSRNRTASVRASSSSGMAKKCASPARTMLTKGRECNVCEDLMKKAAECLGKREYSNMYLNLVTVINEKRHGKDSRHNDLRKTCVDRIVKVLSQQACPDIPPSLTKLCNKDLEDIITSLIEKKKWTQMQVVIGHFQTSSRCHDLTFLHNQLSIQIILSDRDLCEKEDDRCGLLQFLLDNGAVWDPKSSLELVKNAMQLNEFKVVLMLLKKEANPNGITFTKGDTPLHAALDIALTKDPGNFDVFDWLSKKDHSFVDWACVNKQGNTLMHMAAKVKFSHNAVKAIERLSKKRAPVNVRNNDGKLPYDLLTTRNDRRAQFLLVKNKKNAAVVKGSKKQDSEIVPSKNEAESRKTEASPSAKEVKSKEPPKKIFSAKQCKDEMHEMLSNLPDFVIDLFPTNCDSDGMDNSNDDNGSEEQDEEDEEEESEGEDESALPSIDINWKDEEGEMFESLKDVNSDDDGEIVAADFENLPWDVECTEEVWNVLKGQKKQKIDDDDDSKNKTRRKRKKEISESSKRDIVRKIRQLAGGDWTLARPIDLKEESLHLYRVTLCKKTYMLVEVAVAFSSKLKDSAGESGTESGLAYSEIIRVWNIVLTSAEAQHTLQKILVSHRRGKECFVKTNLECKEFEQRRNTSSDLRYPVCYSEAQVTDVTHPENLERNEFTFCPPASTGKMEFHILKFYSFSSTLVSAIFSNADVKVDFPFKVTPKEHTIITLPSQSPILLLGRSGTGKTTICVYRLWKKFMEYWDLEQHQGQPLLARDGPATKSSKVGRDEICGSDSTQGTVQSQEEEREEEEKGENSLNDSQPPLQELVSENKWMIAIENDGSDDDNDDNDEDDDDNEETDNGHEEDVSENKGESKNDGRMTRQVLYNHLHQVFVTKNQQLCGEVGKTFQRLRNSIQFLQGHCQFDDTPLPYQLQDVKEEAFPLFVTSRQILLLLDASLKGDSFFERDENMALKNVIPGWGAQEEIFHNIPLEGSSDEDDDIDDQNERGAAGGRDAVGLRRKQVQDFRSSGAIPKRKYDKQECTYHVFAHEIWNKIAKKKVNEFHPSLVWTEIMSFIKGSYEALHSEKGFLDLRQYVEVGRKRAPNFCGDRKDVYSIFENYMKVKRERRLFDESDLVFNIYTRLREMPHCDWVFHEIYVDELQDFTQAELTLLIALSHEPNKMFLTGDTAQSIMHGISFRFEDVKSLFYFTKKALSKKDKGVRAIKEPERVHQLSYNYRSHAGILSLASSVLDLLTNFFRESYDVLDRDQGLFDGPKPILIESCSQTDLALLLSGNQRKTSHIEFGAHQAILVVNQAARDNIPNDLKSAIVLTIYESKGLEFDDILLYNFFKDSQASKTNEWRVVTEFLNNLVERKKEEGNLDDIDTEILQKPGRPHPLAFNPSQHKLLNTELKHLYTALTRARVNVWIFDEEETSDETKSSESKGAPVFEYFKALKLVKTVGSGDTQENFGAQLFTKKSSAKAWCARGETFMRRRLYEPAAKCFSMAENPKMEMLANAHLLTQKAIELKQPENARHLSQKAIEQKQEKMYLEAGSLFVNCESFHFAARCFSRAKEHLLSALAYEKNGQMEDAARQYRHLSKNIDASRCLEVAGLFDQAIKVLVDSKLFERALDCLLRYDNKLKNCQMDNAAIPQILIDQRPRDSYSEQHLLYKLAEDYLNKDEEKMMFITVERMRELEDQFHFLADKGYTKQAAAVLDRMGQTEEAATLMFQENFFEDGLEYARKGKHSHLEASIHLTKAHVVMAQKQLPEDSVSLTDNDRNELCEQHALKAQELFKQVGDKNGKGQAYYMLGQLNKSKELLLKAHRNFQHVKPPNTAGQIEAFQETFKLHLSGLFDFTECKKHMDMIKKGIDVIKILRNPSREEADRHHAYLTFYGFEFIPGSTSVSWNPNHFQMCWKRLSDDSYGQGKRKTQMEKSKVVEEISESLCLDLTSWVSDVQTSLNALAQFDNSKLSESYVLSFLDTLCLKVEVDYLLQTKGSYFVSHRLNRKNSKWGSVLCLLDFLPPVDQGLWTFDTSLIVKVLKRVRSSKAVKSQLCRYLNYRWDNPARVEHGTSSHLTKERAKESDLLIQTCFYEALFKLDEINAEKKAQDLETDVLRLGKEWAKKTQKYAIFAVVENDVITAVESLGGRFIKSFQLLVGTNNSAPDPFEAVFKFTKLISAFASRRELSIMPRLNHLLFWLELYTSLTFCFIGKARQSRDDLLFYLPASYLHHFDIINMCRGNHSGSIFTDVIKHNLQFKTEKQILDRQAFIINFLVGQYKYRFSLLHFVPGFAEGTPLEVFNTERIIVLILVLLLNTDYNFVKYGYGNNMYKALMEIYLKMRYREKLPQRLRDLISAIPSLTSSWEVYNHLSSFFQNYRGETIVSCHWSDKMAPPLQKRSEEVSNNSEQSFSTTFVEDSNVDNSNWEEESEDGQEEEADEIEKYELEKEAKRRQQELEREETENKAATIIVKCLRRYVEKIKLEKKPYRDYEERHIFAPYSLSAKRCGICGVEFLQGALEDGRERITEGDGPTRELHETSQEHMSTVEHFEEFRRVYHSKIFNGLKDIVLFLDHHKVRESPDIYKNIDNDVKRLLTYLSSFDANLREMMVKREWNKHPRLPAVFSLVCEAFKRCSNMIKRQFEDFQKQHEKNDEEEQKRMNHEEAMTDGFVDDSRDDPYDRPVNDVGYGQYDNGRGGRRGHGRGGQRGRGRGGQRGQGRGGQRGRGRGNRYRGHDRGGYYY